MQTIRCEFGDLSRAYDGATPSLCLREDMNRVFNNSFSRFTGSFTVFLSDDHTFGHLSAPHLVITVACKQCDLQVNVTSSAHNI
jgi:hypothetical protein